MNIPDAAPQLPYVAARRAVTALLCFWLAWPAPAPASGYHYDRSQNRILIAGGGTATLSALSRALPRAPLRLLDADRKVWLLSADVLLQDGSVLRLHGSEIGGDVDELRLRSDNSFAAGSVVSITADHGRIDIRSTRILSWDTDADAPDREYGSYGRAYIRVRSRLGSDGRHALESRMDVIDSEVAYLGYGAAESYGLVWKVLTRSDPYLFNIVQVRGNILNSRLHHNFFGAYAFGAQDSVWRNNEVYNNIQYGLAPHNYSDKLVIDNNDVHHNGSHGIMVWKHCRNLLIRSNRSWANARDGIIVRRSSNRSLIADNRSFGNGGSGINIYASNEALVRNNIVSRNAGGGLELSLGSSGNVIRNNEFVRNGGPGLYLYQGRDLPEPGSDGRPRRNLFSNNLIQRSAEGLRMIDADGNRFVANNFVGNGLDLAILRSSGTELSHNAFHAWPPPILAASAEEGADSAGTAVKVQKKPAAASPHALRTRHASDAGPSR